MGIIQWARAGGVGAILPGYGGWNPVSQSQPEALYGDAEQANVRSLSDAALHSQDWSDSDVLFKPMAVDLSGEASDPMDISRENARLRRQDIETRPTNNLGLTDDQILTGKAEPAGWFQSRIDPGSKTVAVDIAVKYDTDGMSGLEATKLKSLAQNGVAQFWSRPVNLNGETYAVNVNLVDDDNGMPISLRVNDKDSYERSHNMNGGGFFGSILGIFAPLVSRHTSDIYYQKGGVFRSDPALADKDFQVTAAHEIGHAVLGTAGGRGFSWGHEGTSGEFGGENGNRLDVPDSGELDLMKYYKNLKTAPQYVRSIASSDDVKNLIYVSKRN